MSIQKFKKGFTLIELMVVIVIIGILAAVAIPKLFGMSAKAKASEVGPAAGTWSKLQLAYIMEADTLGNFQSISYKAPGDTTGKTAVFDYSGKRDDVGEWEAKTRVNLTDDCITDKIWSAKYTFASPGSPPGEPSEVTNGCPELTPNFCALKTDRTCN